MLERWWDEERPSAAIVELQRALWLRARLTEDPEVAALIYRRLVTEFTEGPLFEAAQERLRQYEAASRWILSPDSNEGDAPKPDSGAGDAPDPGQLALLATGRGVATSTPEGDGRYAIQLGTFRDPARAFLLADSVLAVGPAPRVVGLRRDALVRVRVGRYSDRDQAEQALELFRALGLRGYLVGDVTSERRLDAPVGDAPRSGG